MRIDESWRRELSSEWDTKYFTELTDFVRSRYGSGSHIYPPGGRIFAAFDACPVDKVKVVIIGQDPYHGEGQANGLCFSVGDGVKMPPSLVNIFKEVSSDTGVPFPTSGNLERWARQGVLLLNSVLTVEEGRPGSHQGHGWERFTDAVVASLSRRRDNLVFMLWGSHAIQKGARIDRSRHCVLTAVHPSPLSAYRGFFGCRHFSKANAYLEAHGRSAILW